MKSDDLKEWLWFCLVPAIAISASFFPESIQDLLTFRTRIPLAEQSWSLVTSVFLHTNFNHLLMNVAAFLLIAWISDGSLSGWRLPIVTTACGIGATLGFAIYEQGLSSLVGLSGALHGLVVYIAIREFKASPLLLGMLLLGVIAKITWEQLFGATELTQQLINAHVATTSHLWGALTGAAIGLIWNASSQFISKSPAQDS